MSGASYIEAKLKSVELLSSKPPAPADSNPSKLKSVEILVSKLPASAISNPSKIDSGLRNCRGGSRRRPKGNQPFNSVVRRNQYLHSLLTPDCSSSTCHSINKDVPKNPRMKKVRNYHEHVEWFKKYQSLGLLNLMETLLGDKDYNPSVITWVDASKCMFKITNTTEFAMLRGRGQNGNFKRFDNVNRGIRYHILHSKKLIRIENENLTYQFRHEIDHQH